MFSKLIGIAQIWLYNCGWDLDMYSCWKHFVNTNRESSINPSSGLHVLVFCISMLFESLWSINKLSTNCIAHYQHELSTIVSCAILEWYRLYKIFAHHWPAALWLAFNQINQYGQVKIIQQRLNQFNGPNQFNVKLPKLKLLMI